MTFRFVQSRNKVNAQVKNYPKEQKEAQAKADREAFEAIAQWVQQQRSQERIDPARLDVYVYRAAVESGNYAPERVEAIIAQSKYSRTLKTSDEVRDHIEIAKRDASNPKFGRHRSSGKSEAIKAEQDARNLQALKPSKWLARNKGEQQKDGSYLFQIEAYTFLLKGDHLTVTGKGNKTVLESDGVEVNGRVTHQELDVFQKSVQIEKQSKAQKQKERQMDRQTDPNIVLQTCLKCLQLLGKPTESGLRFEGNRYIFTKQAEDISITAKDGRGVIFKVSEGKIDSKMLAEDIGTIQKLDRHIEAFKQHRSAVSQQSEREIER